MAFEVNCNTKTACTLIIQEAPATPAEAPCPLVIQEAPASPAEAPGTLNLQEAPTISAEAPCALISEKAPANPAEAPHSLGHQETPTFQAEVPDTLNCLKTKDSFTRIPPAGSKEKAIYTFLSFPSGRPAASLEILNSFPSQLKQTNFSSSGNLSPEIQEASKENPQEAAAIVNSTKVESNQEIIPKFRSPCSQAAILPEFANQQNSMKRKRLEPVKPAPSIEEHLINQSLFSYSLTQAIEEDSSTPQSGPQQRAPILLSLPTQSIVPYPTQP
ncbi:hypothetical protein DAPPUDRAFT_332673 [Daphnia pulex]|uniref:Uncharacterized protein n=1 Tax=Daphnia pulex TaxID=6669 RepID=E9HQL9_DAPPU|nr:hypothetical protein DAPPUDRAFT_332673 [Daphnia pulex]|eukprot:EFX65965.1 hypothetical protein DAPPUDRAFT_332673 [Daphnia pulex]